MSIPEPILVVYSEPPKAIATTDLRQSRFDEFLASRSLQPKIRKAFGSISFGVDTEYEKN